MLVLPAWASLFISRWIFSGKIGSAICKCTRLSDHAAGLNGKPQQHFCLSDSRPCTMTECPGDVRDHSAESGDSTWSPMEKAAAPGSLPHILGCFLPWCLTDLLCQLEPWGSCCWLNRSINSPVQIQMKASPSQGGLVPGVCQTAVQIVAWKAGKDILWSYQQVWVTDVLPLMHSWIQSLKCQPLCHSYSYSWQRWIYSDTHYSWKSALVFVVM